MSSVFQERIQEDPDICNNCFRRTHDRFVNNYSVDTYEGELWIKKIEGVSDSLYRHDDDTDRIPADKMTAGQKTVCVCGFRPFSQDHESDSDWKDRPLSKERCLAHAHRLHARLSEAGIEIDKDCFLDVLESLKSDPDNQFADERLYQQAIERVRHQGRV